MIYNLGQYIKDRLTNDPNADSINTDLIQALTATGFNPKLRVDEVALNQTGGVPHHFDRMTSWTAQLIFKTATPTRGYTWATKLYNLLLNYFGEALPAVTIEGVVYPAVTAWQISPLQTPSYMGVADDGSYLYVFNLLVVTY